MAPFILHLGGVVKSVTHRTGGADALILIRETDFPAPMASADAMELKAGDRVVVVIKGVEMPVVRKE